ncbi:NlpC/P60 family protein [Streptomyces albogriseolus]|uniref:Secreted protein n=2 Tax=unclassified Streptomyces TaxID=2593676 RepID=V9Z5V7_9ACTN|nr:MULTISPECIES: C40 family peptidase [unclassified Streptomyces]AHE38887.1 Secreted protein [Streptomyces sp. FR1]AHE39369.1 Secreted protein [Streptomyces sp. F2]
MAKHRRPKPPNRARIATLGMAAGAVSLLPTQSQAAPKPTVDEVRKQVEQLYEEAEAPTEEYNAVREKQQKLQGEVDGAQDRLARKQEEINELREKIGPLAAAQYRNGGIDPSVELFLSGDPDDYLDKAQMLDRTGDRQADALRAMQSKQRELAQERATAQQRLKSLEETRAKAAEKKDEVQGKLTEARKLLNSLTAAQRAKMEAAQERDDASAGASDAPAGYNGPASGRAKTAIEFAYAQLGKPYEWGSTGPNSYDCSGLVGAAWRSAGVSLPRTVQQMYDAGRKVSKSDLQPGDIIYWYNDTQHNGMYVGNGKAIHAPRTGKNIEIVPLDSMPFFAASRP